MKRRTAIKLTLAAGAIAATAPQRLLAVDYKKPVPEAKGLTSYLKNAQVQLRWNNQPLVAYRAHPSLKYPYFYPLNGLGSGTSVTTESALPYPHHRGLWLGCQPLNDGDYWGDNNLDAGQVRSDLLEMGEITEKSVEFLNNCKWVRKDNPSPWSDERKFKVTLLNEKVWVLDADIKITASEDVEIKKAKHSFFAIRAASDISPAYGGVLMNSEGGVGAEETLGKEAGWCGYHGKRAGNPDIVEGITVMTHPDNPWKSTWLTRDYGHLSPSPFYFLDKPWQLKKGNSIDLKYRVAVHVGTPEEADMDGIYKQWIYGDPVAPVSVHDIPKAGNIDMLVYPNPAGSHVNLAFAEPLAEKVHIQLFTHT